MSNNKEMGKFLTDNKKLFDTVPKEVLKDVVECKEMLIRNGSRFSNEFSTDDKDIEDGFKDTDKVKDYFERLGGMFYTDIKSLKPDFNMADSVYRDKGGTYYEYGATMDSPADSGVADIDLFNNCVESVMLAQYFTIVSEEFTEIVENLEKRFDVKFPKGVKEEVFREDEIPKDFSLLKEAVEQTPKVKNFLRPKKTKEKRLVKEL